MPGTRLTPSPWWTPWPGTGPGADLLGDLTGRRLVELGCGHGANAAALASEGAEVEAIDISPAAIATARSRWGEVPGVRFVCADASTYLTADSYPCDVLCSIFGALSFASPTLLIDVGDRLRSGGLLAVSARLDHRGRTPSGWERLAALAGFSIERWQILDDPSNPAAAPCLIFTGERQ